MKKNIPIQGIVKLVEGFNLVHDEIFEEHEGTFDELDYRLISFLERAIDNVMRKYGIDPAVLHELMIEIEETGRTTEEILQTSNPYLDKYSRN